MDIKEKNIYLDQVLFLLGIFIKEFYLFPSGSFQIGDLLLILSVFVCFFRNHCKIYILTEDVLFICFVMLVTIINSYYSVFLKNNFSKVILFYFYNLLILLVFTFYLHSNNYTSFLKHLLFVFKMILITQLIVLLIGRGKWYGGVRYEGTFNDPNQYGVFIIFSIFFIYIISYYLKKRFWIWIFIGFGLIIPCASMGMIGSIVIFMIVWTIQNFATIDRRVIILALLIILLFGIIFGGILLEIIRIPESIKESYVFKRVMNKINSLVISNSATSSLVEDRGWSRLIEYPEYIIIGAGEGDFERFNSFLEIHSSILGPLFYYGIIPFIILCIWYVIKLVRIDSQLLCVYLSLFVESFFLVNTRQPTFWMLFAVTEITQRKKEELTTALI